MLDNISIIDGKKHITLYFYNNKIYSFSNVDNVDIDKYLNLLKTDNPIEFYNKGIDSTLYKYKGKHLKSNNKKRFHFGIVTIMLSLTALLTANALIHAKNINTNINDKVIEDYCCSDIYNMINSSRSLNDDEKEFLYNEDLFNDVLKIINEDNYLKYMYSIYFYNIKIENYSYKERNDNTIGFYNIDSPNVIHIKNYTELNDNAKDTIAHEFIHLCQETNSYNFIIEAGAEIISNEYYGTPISSYSRQVKIIKKLMEIIGAYPIMVYNFTGDFSLIEERVKPFLTEEEYAEFLDDLTFDYDYDDVNIPKYNSLEVLLGKLYKNIYNGDINNNKIFHLIDNSNTLNRYYFNSKLKDTERTYYLDYDMGEYKLISLKEAIDNGLVRLYSIVKTPIDKELALTLAQTGQFSLERIIDYKSANISITRTTLQNNKMFISGSINEKNYENYDVDLLVKHNVIDVDYYLLNVRSLNSKEYLNHQYPYDATIKLFKSDNVQIDGDNVYSYEPKKVVLPLVHEIYPSIMNR